MTAFRRLRAWIAEHHRAARCRREPQPTVPPAWPAPGCDR